MKKSAEFRSLEIKGLECRAKDGTAGELTGYAVVYEQLSEELGMFTKFREKIARGAFGDSIQGDIRALWSHEEDSVLGRTKSGTLRLKDDEIGINFSLDLPDNTLGRDAFVTISRGDVTGMSFGFMVVEDEWVISADGTSAVRSIKSAQLFEISPVAFPAYSQTVVDTRDLKSLEAAASAALSQRIAVPASSYFLLKNLQLDEALDR